MFKDMFSKEYYDLKENNKNQIASGYQDHNVSYQ